MKSCSSFLALASVVVSLTVLPTAVHAQSWGYLFTDLTWPDSSNPVRDGAGLTFGNSAGSALEVSSAGEGSDFGGFLFSDLTWPDASDPFYGEWNMDLWPRAPSDTNDNQGNGSWNYLFRDLP